MLCQQSQGQITNSSWLLNIDENHSLSLDTKTMTWRSKNLPEDTMNEWKNDAELEKDLRFSIAECSAKINGFLNPLIPKEWSGRFYLDYQIDYLLII